MQRSFSYQNVISRLFLVVLFVFYISLSSMYLLMPPLLAVLFFLYYDALSKHDLFSLVTVAVMLLIFEAEKGFWFGSTLVFFTVITQYMLPKVEQTIRCKICLAAVLVALAYPGYWMFMWFVNQVLMLSPPVIDWHMWLYMIIEFLIVSVFI